MKSSKNRSLVRAVSLLLVSLLLLGALASCTSRGKTLLTLDKDGVRVTLSVNVYEFMLSRWKGACIQGQASENGITADREAFWDMVDKFNGTDLQTRNDFYNSAILENCKTVLAALWLFEKEGLSLDRETVNTIDEYMDELVDSFGDGSRTKLNSVLAQYGVNYKILREVYQLEAKLTLVQNHFYGSDASKIGSTVKDEFLMENYIRFKQIHLPAFHYVYQTDKNGDVIYYVPESQTASICYDTGVNTFPGGGKRPIYDSNGDEIRYVTEDENNNRIAYDKTKGIPSYVLDENGVSKTTEMTKEELDALKARAEKLYAALEGCTVAEFEQAIEDNHQKVRGDSTYPDGYYLQKNIDYASVSSEFAYLSDIAESMKQMKVGDVCLITSAADGYHIVMKYEPVKGAYDDPDYQDLLSGFAASLAEALFLEKCAGLTPEIAVNEKILATATEIKRIGGNYYF